MSIIEIDEKCYLKDPQSTLLGRKIITESIRQIDQWGLEAFTFRKLALAINSTEASVYRYFANKYILLSYLTSLYREWVACQIRFHTNNVSNPVQRLKIIIGFLSQAGQESFNTSYTINTYLDECALSRIVAKESSKTYLYTSLDYYQPDQSKPYQILCSQTVQLINEINPEYPYTSALVDALFKLTHMPLSPADTIPCVSKKDNSITRSKLSITPFLEHLICSSLLHTKITCHHD